MSQINKQPKNNLLVLTEVLLPAFTSTTQKTGLWNYNTFTIIYFSVFSFKVKVINKEDELPGPRSCMYEPPDTYPEDQDLQGSLESGRWPTVSWSCQL